MEQKFYSNGKLLLTGEYVVLDGAKALALPTQKGQSLVVTTNQSGKLFWKSYDCYEKCWFATEIETFLLTKEEAPTGQSDFDLILFKILWHAQQLNPKFLNPNLGYTICTYLDFERLWGLGTSSTLINNIAHWAQVNAFELLNLSFGGSGYDIACAQAKGAIFYQRSANINQPMVTPISFNPSFKNYLFFIYLNEKKNSKEAISTYKRLHKTSLKSTIETINLLTEEIAHCTNLNAFEQLINTHEQLIASLLKTPTVKQQRFANYTGSIKSLGGWGGDFVLATGTLEDMAYFNQKGYATIIPFEQMIL